MNASQNIDLITKYNKPGPRYTSYPAYPHWEGICAGQWIKEIQTNAKAVDLYIHIPYCESLCTYCGCTRTISRDKKKGDEYIDALIKEFKIYQDICPDLEISSLHFGGGTPTFLSAAGLKKLLSAILTDRPRVTSASIELDPRVTSPDQIEVLMDFGLNRFSLGIQDFDPAVQKAINRIQSFELTDSLLTCIKEEAASRGQQIEINFDLIYGLPLQTKETISDTMRKVNSLAPDTIALYGYAHVPWRSKAQKSLERYGLPTGQEKLDLYFHSKELLQVAGYRDIGLDHFAKAQSSLYQAFTLGKLQRNFMGYTTKKEPTLIGLGASSISNTPGAFAQNEKDIGAYLERIHRGELAITHGHLLSPADRIVANSISQIMCAGATDLAPLFENSSSELEAHLRTQIDGFVRDGLIELHGTLLSVLPSGMPFLRNICMEFDHHLGKGNRFSQTI